VVDILLLLGLEYRTESFYFYFFGCVHLYYH
jgi:hypothetical protein